MNNLSNKNNSNIIITDTIFKEYIHETDKILKFLLNLIIFSGAISFLIVGISSYLKHDLVYFLKSDDIIFFPQGLTMCFYGVCGTIVSINQMMILGLGVGEGYNEFDKSKEIMKIFRKGMNGDKSDINITYPLKDIEAIKVEIKTELFNTKQNIYVCIKGKNDLPILQIEKPLKINDLERKASEIASFLKIPVRGT